MPLFRVDTVVWAALWSSIAGVAVMGVVTTTVSIQSAASDDAYFRASARLWFWVGAVAAAMMLALTPALAQMGSFRADARPVVVACILVPTAALVVGCWFNAGSLFKVSLRRRHALRLGTEFDAVVLAREPKPFAHDILRVTVRAEVPDTTPLHTGGYRHAASDNLRDLRLVETCPGDQWGRLSPGKHVRVRLDLADPTRRYALVLLPGS